MKAYKRNRVVTTLILNLLNTKSGKQSASCLGCFPSAKVPGTQRLGVYVDHTASLDASEKRKTSSPCRDLNPILSSPYPSHNTSYTITASIHDE
jgi:hypothetical protein